MNDGTHGNGRMSVPMYPAHSPRKGTDMSSSDPYQPTREDHFTFGLWTVGNRGSDPFGTWVRPPLAAPYIVERLAALGPGA
jgi:hypothetical protein